MKIGEKVDFSYTGDVQEFIVPVSGIYQLECWGAQGGFGESYAKSKGGYARGTLKLSKGDVLYAYVGESGRYTTYGGNTHSSVPVDTLGGWNGGGNVLSSQASHGSGGGGTDFRLVNGTWNNLESLLSRIIVAGGGAGTGYWTNKNGSGGGTTGIGTLAGSQTSGGEAGDSKSTAGSFGVGGEGRGDVGGGSGGGGGWYGGGGATGVTASNGGGSGYVLTETSFKPFNYSPTKKYWMTDTQLLAGNVDIPLTTGTGTQVGNTGDGFARITLIESFNTVDIKCNINNQMREAESVSVKINNSWKEVESIFIKVGNEWKLNS